MKTGFKIETHHSSLKSKANQHLQTIFANPKFQIPLSSVIQEHQTHAKAFLCVKCNFIGNEIQVIKKCGHGVCGFCLTQIQACPVNTCTAPLPPLVLEVEPLQNYLKEQLHGIKFYCACKPLVPG